MVKNQPWLAPLLQVASENVHVTIAVEHTVECFFCFRRLLGVQVDIVPAVSAAAGITLALYTAPDLDRLTSDGATLGRGMTMAGAQVGIVDVDLAKSAVDAEFLLHDDLLIS